MLQTFISEDKKNITIYDYESTEPNYIFNNTINISPMKPIRIYYIHPFIITTDCSDIICWDPNNNIKWTKKGYKVAIHDKLIAILNISGLSIIDTNGNELYNYSTIVNYHSIKFIDNTKIILLNYQYNIIYDFISNKLINCMYIKPIMGIISSLYGDTFVYTSLNYLIGIHLPSFEYMFKIKLTFEVQYLNVFKTKIIITDKNSQIYVFDKKGNLINNFNLLCKSFNNIFLHNTLNYIIIVTLHSFYIYSNDGKLLNNTILPINAYSSTIDDNNTLVFSDSNTICIYKFLGYKIFKQYSTPNKILSASLSLNRKFLIVGTTHSALIFDWNSFYSHKIKDNNLLENISLGLNIYNIQLKSETCKQYKKRCIKVAYLLLYTPKSIFGNRLKLSIWDMPSVFSDAVYDPHFDINHTQAIQILKKAINDNDIDDFIYTQKL